MIEAENLSKRYGDKVAVQDVSFTVEPGRVTGFLGPNGAGKSTTMRMLLGLDTPDTGRAAIAGKPYHEHERPMAVVGALLGTRAWHPGRSAFNHLLWLAQTQGVARRRVTEVIDLVGLGSSAHRRVGGFSLGMCQRLAIASALLAEPGVLVLDEPVNGLDPVGVRWIRDLMKSQAAEGRTVLVASHLLNEMAVTADHLIVIGRGRIIADCSTQDFLARNATSSVLVRSAHSARLRELITEAGGACTSGEDDSLIVSGLDPSRIAEVALAGRLTVHELTPQFTTLEEAFMEATNDSVEYHGEVAAARPSPTTVEGRTA
ncbi:ATP-binding cassette domain-containing protein [Streptomyces sp. RG80]|uniref:ABC transporter ATP-binding protein n=1 Tax=Streptomyces sp. RG80 TaxID=3157340 RepID=UPI00338F0675